MVVAVGNGGRQMGRMGGGGVGVPLPYVETGHAPSPGRRYRL